MRKVIQAFCLFMCTVLITVQTAQASNPSAANIFSSIGGTTTIDRGGAIHSQARSIYSLGGGMVSFQGKKVSLLAADPPGFTAGCNGISWHFGGFAFISLDEIRQLVEAVAQASLGIAVDLAMQTLCPQCYAVMAKLREISNLMRNAAADACRIAMAAKQAMIDKGYLPSTARASECSTKGAGAGKTTSYLEGWAGTACRLLDDAESELKTAQKGIDDFLALGNKANSSASPGAEDLLLGNVTYKALSALGYEDGVTKDLVLSLLGFTVVNNAGGPDCKETFKDLIGSANAELKDPLNTDMTAENKAALERLAASQDPTKIEGASDSTGAKAADGQTTEAKTETGGSKSGPTFCNAPPLLAGIEYIGRTIMCGFEPQSDIYLFRSNYFSYNPSDLNNTSLYVMCTAGVGKENANPYVYSCRGGAGDCTKPVMKRFQDIIYDASQGSPTSANGYTGLGWMVADALYAGAKAVHDNTALPPRTVKILNGSNWPLYRLINMAAVYPELAGELLNAYSAAIASQYVMDTLDKVLRVGAQPSVNTKSSIGLRPEAISRVREEITSMANVGDEVKSRVMARIAQKRQLVDVIMQVNKTLQAEVIGQGLGGNADLAVSIKRQATAAAKKAATDAAAKK